MVHESDDSDQSEYKPAIDDYKPTKNVKKSGTSLVSDKADQRDSSSQRLYPDLGAATSPSQKDTNRRTKDTTEKSRKKSSSKSP